MQHFNPNSANGRPLERKDGGDLSLVEVKKLINQVGSNFEDFKSANDERLKQIEKGGASDPLTEEKLAKIEKDLSGSVADLNSLKSAIDDLSVKINRPRGGNGQEETPDQIEHRKAFNGYLKKGRELDLGDLQEKALNISTDGDGGYAVPEAIDRDISSQLVDVSPIRSEARIVQVGTSDYKKLVNAHGTASGWVDEDDARPQTDASKLKSVAPPIGEIYAMPAATQTMLDDVFFDAEAWIAEEVQIEFAKQEGVAFISGDGSKKPKGFLSYATAATDDASRAFGTLQHVVTGKADGFSATGGADVLIDMLYALKAGHRQNSKWMMASPTVGTVRKLKDSDGNYIWQPGLALDRPDLLLGRPVVTAEDMPKMAADALPIALANWKAAYYVVDRMGTRILRDPFTAKPYVLFYVTKRVGGAVIDSEAIKLLKVAA
ncbi:MAG: phage major capsid protein [Cohaesibacter sp.]|nr:phage major capsid protein [Cohaesibacter sp.]